MEHSNETKLEDESAPQTAQSSSRGMIIAMATGAGLLALLVGWEVYYQAMN